MRSNSSSKSTTRITSPCAGRATAARSRWPRPRSCPSWPRTTRSRTCCGSNRLSTNSCILVGQWKGMRAFSATPRRSLECRSSRAGSSVLSCPGWRSRTHSPKHKQLVRRRTMPEVIDAPQNASVDEVREAMMDVVDPELGVNIVDLGLVYGISVEVDGTAVIEMTLTSAACPLTDVIEDQTAQSLEGIVPAYRINWVWMPPWGPEKITEDGREQMRALGFNIRAVRSEIRRTTSPRG